MDVGTFCVSTIHKGYYMEKCIALSLALLFCTTAMATGTIEQADLATKGHYVCWYTAQGKYFEGQGITRKIARIRAHNHCAENAQSPGAGLPGVGVCLFQGCTSAIE